jgi:hypothetical protein
MKGDDSGSQNIAKRQQNWEDCRRGGRKEGQMEWRKACLTTSMSSCLTQWRRSTKNWIEGMQQKEWQIEQVVKEFCLIELELELHGEGWRSFAEI